MIFYVNFSISIQFVAIIVIFTCKIEADTQNKIDLVMGNEFPYVVSIQSQRDATSPWKHECHGTLIHKRWILTYAFCGM